jgi:hypothetical protein
VRELRTLRRTRLGSRVRSVQGRLSIELGIEDEVGDSVRPESQARNSGFRRPVKSPSAVAGPDPSATAKVPAPIFHPLAYRSVVADWAIDTRKQWGLRANELESAGLSWRDAETQAFVEVWHQLRRASKTKTTEGPPPANGIAE